MIIRLEYGKIYHDHRQISRLPDICQAYFQFALHKELNILHTTNYVFQEVIKEHGGRDLPHAVW